MNQILPSEAVNACLGVSRQSGTILSLLCECLQILLEKRITLEEKMIRAYLLELAAAQVDLSRHLIAIIANPEGKSINDESLQALTLLNENIISALADFLKAARYDLNYLEQYFEHGFCGRLQSSEFKDGLLRFANEISEQSANSI